MPLIYIGPNVGTSSVMGFTKNHRQAVPGTPGAWRMAPTAHGAWRQPRMAWRPSGDIIGRC